MAGSQKSSNLVNRVRRIQDSAIDEASENESNLVSVERSEVSLRTIETEEEQLSRSRLKLKQEESDANPNPNPSINLNSNSKQSQKQKSPAHKIYSLESGATFTRPNTSESRWSRSEQATGSEAEFRNRVRCKQRDMKQQSSSADYTTPKLLHRHHAPSCSANKLIQLTENRFKQHEPHCIHHNVIQQKELASQKSAEQVVGLSNKCRSNKLQLAKRPDKSYLLVQYADNERARRPSGRFEQPGNASQSCAVSSGDNRATVKFISQLYFLLHLSAILSLLMHHKNLVTSERKVPDEPFVAHRVKKFAMNNSESESKSESGSSDRKLESGEMRLHELPVPLMQLSSTRQISSVVLSTNSPVRPQSVRHRFGRQTGSEPYANSDILVNLVGEWHAKCALHYFLCYLLSSSLTVLVCLRLFRLCAQPDERQTEIRQDGFYYRTRLDCTPVLIGSISLGLIQLIVIGLEVAKHLNMADDSTWPLYLPFLHFAFVSLLVQFILNKVAKNREQKRSNCLSINDGKRSSRLNDKCNNNGTKLRFDFHNSPSAISGGLQNIALAHLLVTHILLWLMRLNSISLFQPLDNRTFQQQQLNSTWLYQDTQSNSEFGEKEQRSRAELERILRSGRKALDSALSVPTEISLVSQTKSQFPLKANAESEEVRERGLRSTQSDSSATDRPSQLAKLIGHKQSQSLNLNSTSVTLSQIELLRLLTLAAKNERDQMRANISLSQFKSSLPKRMTAFRQSKSATLTNIKQPVRVLITHDPTTTTTTTTTTSTTTTTTTTTTPPPPERTEVARPQPDERAGRESPKAEKKGEPNSTERPFPSVDSDPPTRTSSPVELESASVSSVDRDEESEDSDGEADLDSLLPPVPNYNETTSDTEEIDRSPKKRTQSVGREKSTLSEEALVFNEAASMLNVNISRDLQQNRSEPIKEALVMSAVEERNQPSFADFLLPIVHQYHILIIAILFNMWLDSLRSKAANPLSNLAEKSNCASELETGTESASSSSKGLVGMRNKAKFRCKMEREPKYALPNAERVQRAADRWRLGAKKEKSRSVDMIYLEQQQQQQHQQQAHLTEEEASSSLSRYNSLRSSSSEQLLWMSSRKESERKQLAYSTRSFSSANTRLSETTEPGRAVWPSTAKKEEEEEPTSAVCAIFFGLLVVSGSLIVILLDVSLLSMLSQCLTQLISIAVCLLGLALIWRANLPAKSVHSQSHSEFESSHRQCFHYLFLLAAYFCGISIALNLSKEQSPGRLFSQPVIYFLQRQLADQPTDEQPIATANYLLLFHSLLALKGLLLILQVTLQTLLIYSSCQRATRQLRQIYTFLMFANLSLWAMEICEQQQHLQRHLEATNSHLVSLNSFSRFAASIVTLSHLYHGLVFMQH